MSHKFSYFKIKNIYSYEKLGETPFIFAEDKGKADLKTIFEIEGVLHSRNILVENERIIRLLHELKESLGEVKEAVQTNTATLQAIAAAGNASTHMGELPEDLSLPISKSEDLAKWEAALVGNQKLKSDLVSYRRLKDLKTFSKST